MSGKKQQMQSPEAGACLEYCIREPQGGKCSWNGMCEEEGDKRSEKGLYHVKSCSLRREFKFYSE